MRAVAAAVVPGLLALLLAGCSLLPAPTPVPNDRLPVGVTVVTPPDEIRLAAVNQTTIPVVLVINGRQRPLAPGASAELTVSDLGPLPWDLAFTTVAGRQLLRDTLHDGVLSRTNDGGGRSSATGFLARADLSCG